MVSFRTDMPGPVSHPDIQRLNQHLESGSHPPSKVRAQHWPRLCLERSPSRALPAQPSSLRGVPSWPAVSASLTLRCRLPPSHWGKWTLHPQGTCRSSCLETEDGATSLPLILIRKASVPRSLEATAEPDIVTDAMSTVQKPQNRTRNIFFVTDKHSSI